ncbi:MAG: hypothetical protein ACTHLR_12940 [Rhizomicrobium sp.]
MRFRSLARIAPIFIFLIAGTAFAGAPRTGGWLFNRLADQADARAQSAGAADARTWHGWATQYRQVSVQPNVRDASALDLTAQLAQINERDAAAATDPRAAALSRASVLYWQDLHEQLERGGPVVAHFPKEMLIPVPGMDGTPWASNTPHATASDCAAISQRVQLCRAQVGQATHEQMTGLYGDQSSYLLVRQQQCHRWEEAYVAYCAK